jgi:hypothetical protein
MGSCCQADTPTPPNPTATAAAQTGTNVSTAVANNMLNNMNQQTPGGSLTYNNTGAYDWVDPSTGTSYSVPTRTVTQSLLNPTQYLQQYPDVLQAARDQGVDPNTFAQQHYDAFGRFEGRSAGTNADIYGQTEQSKLNLAQMANQQSGALKSMLGQPINISGAPQAGDPNSLTGFSLDDSYGNPNDTQMRGFGDAGAITRDYGPADGFSADRLRVEQAMYERMAPQLEKDRLRMEAQLRDQGNLVGGEAYGGQKELFNKQLTDTRLGITAAGGQEQKLLNDMAAQRAGFQNAAQKQAFEQQQGRATFYNAAQQQDFTQQGLRAQFKNQTQGQRMAMQQAKLEADNNARKQWLSEQYALRQSPINEITALMSGSQVQQPSWANTQSSQIPTTDYAGLVNNRFSQDMANYQQSSQNFNQIMGGIFGAVAGLTRSDRREKDVGRKLGTVFAAGPDGEKPLPIHEYKYKDDPAATSHVGPMAQDVEKVDRGAVKTIKGTKYIDMTRMGSILRDKREARHG